MIELYKCSLAQFHQKALLVLCSSLRRSKFLYRKRILTMEGYEWVQHNGSNSLPENALLAGNGPSGRDIYVGRASHENELIPAEIIPEQAVAYVSWGGKEHEKKEFQVLCQRKFAWVSSSNGLVPEHAVVAGQTADGALYVGRVFHKGSYSVGKVQPSDHCLYIPDDGEEVSFRDYEVLIFH